MAGVQILPREDVVWRWHLRVDLALLAAAAVVAKAPPPARPLAVAVSAAAFFLAARRPDFARPSPGVAALMSEWRRRLRDFSLLLEYWDRLYRYYR